LKSTFLIGCSGYLFPALQVQAVRFTNLRYFFSQLCDALFDGLLHEDRLAEHRDYTTNPGGQCPFQNQALLEGTETRLRDCRINEFGQPRRERFWNALGF